MISSSVISAPSGLCSGIRGLECWDRFVTGFWFPLLHGCVFLYHQYILIGQFLAVWYVYRRASVALNVWQPQVVRGRQKQLVQQCTVSVDSRVSDLNMELKVCKQQIATYKNSYNKEKHKLNEYEEALKRAKYHPLQDSHTSGVINEPRAKRKKLK